jgi:hypothetical protein
MIEVPNEDEEEEGEESFDDSFDDDLAEEAEEEESDDIENIKELDVSILESVNTVQEEGRESREVGLPKKKKHKTKIRKRMTFLDSDSGGDSGEDGVCIIPFSAFFGFCLGLPPLYFFFRTRRNTIISKRGFIDLASARASRTCSKFWPPTSRTTTQS